MTLFAKLTDGREVVVWSDNETEETVTVYPVADLPNFDAEVQSFETIPYSQVVRTDRNRTVAFS
jgi:hypothetical protein